MKITNKIFLSLVPSFLLLLAPASQAALVLNGMNTAPTPGADWAYYAFTPFSGDNFVLNGGLDYTDNTVAPGQSFTTGSGTGLQLDAITFVRSFDSFGGSPTDLRLNFGTLSGTTFTSLYDGTASFDTSVVTNNPYLTFSGFTPIALSANTLYGFVISRSANSGYIGWTKNYSNNAGGDAYLGGQVFNGPNTGTGTATFAVGDEYSDHGFYAQISSVPEPSTYIFILGGLGLMLLFRRRLVN